MCSSHEGGKGPWLEKSHLRFSNTRQQEYGPPISDKMELVVDGTRTSLPTRCRSLLSRIAEEATRRRLDDSAALHAVTDAFLRVNYYCAAGGGYMHKHMDSKKCFGPVIACCSLLSDTQMTFYDTNGSAYGLAPVLRTVVVHIPRRSLYFMSGPARFQWQHGIRKEHCPKERLSLTFRTLHAEAPRTTCKVVGTARHERAAGVLLKRPAGPAANALKPDKRRRKV